MNRLLIFIISILFVSCNPNFVTYEKYPKVKNIIHIDEAKKFEPYEVEHLMVQSYTDSIFPNEDILRFKNLKSLIIVGRRLNKKEITSKEQALKIRIDIDKLSKLDSLIVLRMERFDFSNFPIGLTELSQLEYLALESSLIKEIPPEIKSLENLDHLSFRLNQLNNIPSELSDLKNLRAIDLTNNNLTDISDALIKSESLKLIVLSNIESSQEIKKGPWYWPYTWYANNIDYNKSIDKLRKLTLKDSMNITIQINDYNERERLKSKLNKQQLKSIKIVHRD